MQSVYISMLGNCPAQMKRLASAHQLALMAAFVLWPLSVLSDVGEPDPELLAPVYSFIVKMSCADDEYREYLQLDDASCMSIGEKAIATCERQLKPILESFRAEDLNVAEQNAASWALYYCVQSLTSFDPDAIGKANKVRDESHGAPAQPVVNFDQLREHINMFSAESVAGVIDFARRSNYWSISASDTIVRFQLNKSDGFIFGCISCGERSIENEVT